MIWRTLAMTYLALATMGIGYCLSKLALDGYRGVRLKMRRLKIRRLR